MCISMSSTFSCISGVEVYHDRMPELLCHHIIPKANQTCLFSFSECVSIMTPVYT